MSTLQEKIKAITGNKRQFLLMRVAGMDVDFSMKQVSVTRGTYNSWFKDKGFALLYKQLSELIQEHRQEAVQMIRKGNQLEAVLLEGEIIKKLKEELDSGEYVLAKTNLGREVYSKLVSDLDVPPPQIQNATWQQRIDHLQQFFQEPRDRIEGGNIIDAEFEEISSEQEEHSESDPTQESQLPSDEDTSKAKE